MIYGLYVAAIAAVGALLASLVLYRRRKIRKPANHGYCITAVPPGGDPVTDRIHFYCAERPD